MLKSSSDFHTITLSSPPIDHEPVLNAFIDFNKRTGALKIYKDKSFGWIIKYHTENKGIEWSIRYNDWLYEKTGYCAKVFVTINPKILAGIQDYITAATLDDMETAIANFDSISRSISPLLGTFNDYTITRIDYCINFSLSELTPDCTAEQVMYLIKKSNIPPTYKEWMQYDEISHRMKSKPSSFYLTNRSIHINCYSKYMQLQEKSEENIRKHFPLISLETIDRAKDIIRFEVQCLYQKTYSLSRKVQQSENYNHNLYEQLLNHTECISRIEEYFTKTIGRGDWYTLQEAIKIINRQEFNRQKENRLVDALQFVNQCRSVTKAKESCGKHDLESFKRTLKELSSIGINPVTIPKEWGIKHIPNLLNAYFDKVNDKKHKKDMEIFLAELGDGYIREHGCLSALKTK